MAPKSDLSSAKVISRRLMPLCHKKKSQILIITNKDFLLCLMAHKPDLIVPKVVQCQGAIDLLTTLAL